MMKQSEIDDFTAKRDRIVFSHKEGQIETRSIKENENVNKNGTKNGSFTRHPL